ncbi:hypothetical protein QBC47DRAFT_389884 [Echria macrotheca]|uniref:4'-phosphopantetheinyl transferase domain-containing protein n=1 Tax=Echria macrotheca TaxID=438768 RepID=A0AAJ0B7G8_9PEZI|nr:hypothetical protein QBC47DRAFT_389884 [Echria macrotheca]
MLREAAVYMAGRFAAKEAAIKAHPHRRLTFHDVIVRRMEELRSEEGGVGVDAREDKQESRLGSGPPVVLVRGEGAEGLDQVALVSISHDGDYATAVCLGFDPARMGSGTAG